MNAMTLLPIAALFVLVDFPWLWATGDWSSQMFKKVQGGRPLEVRWAAAPPVYLFLAVLLQMTRSLENAVVMGLCVYGVYEFTNLTALTNYDPQFAVADTLWGGALFGIVRTLSTYFNLL
jgi:uncharacterized membrane protein